MECPLHPMTIYRGPTVSRYVCSHRNEYVIQTPVIISIMIISSQWKDKTGRIIKSICFRLTVNRSQCNGSMQCPDYNAILLRPFHQMDRSQMDSYVQSPESINGKQKEHAWYENPINGSAQNLHKTEMKKTREACYQSKLHQKQILLEKQCSTKK